MSSTKSVKFRKDSPPSGPRSNGHHRSDSGVGSLSDYDSRDAGSDRDEPRRYSITSLQDALRKEREAKDAYLRKLQETTILLDGARRDLSDTRKELQEHKACIGGFKNRNELLEQESRTLVDENKRLQDDKAALEEKLLRARSKLDKAGAGNTPPPTMSGALPAESSPPDKIKRRSSKSYKAAEADKEKEKLRGRFERSDQSDSTSNGSSKSARRRQSYVEPLGQPAPRPSVPMPPSPSRHYSSYATTPQYPAQYGSILEPATTPVPRSVRPTVTYTASAYEEDGNYNVHPLPAQKSSRHQR